MNIDELKAQYFSLLGKGEDISLKFLEARLAEFGVLEEVKREANLKVIQDLGKEEEEEECWLSKLFKKSRHFFSINISLFNLVINFSVGKNDWKS